MEHSPKSQKQVLNGLALLKQKHQHRDNMALHLKQLILSADMANEAGHYADPGVAPISLLLVAGALCDTVLHTES